MIQTHIESSNFKNEGRSLSSWESLDIKNGKAENKLLTLWLMKLPFHKSSPFSKDYTSFIDWLIYVS